ncbi:helix-turn-helix transcriptional regulator [Steroidobacter sp. S1-65]|uniref:Helix-turn-helix transcriptional regulator n=1 Tax=Steroidobacter gossypii TaxID=2805490 RepID=A0ABS1X523_9GAMM|nr:helix-turn-helix transcriptional regulator [Steroidobacter gossypii]MBM0108329.1 helix-turn-helix transcriptional regulator [Steroidobacter gossypii]
MSECAQIIAVLKRSLKARGTTYRDLAKAVGLSEASVKRIFAEETFSLTRLEQICTALGLSIVEVAKMAAQQTTPGGQELSVEQEQVLAEDSRLLACFHLLINGHKPAAIAEELDLSERDLRRLLVKLDAARLIELQPKMKVRLRTSNVIVWRSDGPVRRLYEQRVKREFLQSDFAGRNEFIGFSSAELSEASAKILTRKLEGLARDFAELAALDAGVRDKGKRSIGLLLALRPWVFSMYDGLRKRA